MGLRIEGDAGDGIFEAGVDNEGRIQALAVTIPLDAHVNIESGKVWSIDIADQTPTGAGDYIFYMKNTGDKVLHITDSRLSAETAATQLEWHVVTGTVSGGTTNTPISRTLGSAATVTAIIESGADITGLTSEGTLFYQQLITVGKEEHLSTSSRIRIPKGKAIALLVETATASITGTISIAEEE